MIGWGWGSLWAQNVSVRGQHDSYVNKPILVTTEWNPILSVPRNAKTVVCSENGVFEHSFELATGQVVQFETGIYQAYLYMEPGFHYELELPDYREKKYADRISPFYQPEVLQLKVISRRSLGNQKLVDGSRDVNHRIAQFDSLFARENNAVILARRLQQPDIADSLINSIESLFAADSSIFFKDHRRYRYGILKLNEGKTGLESISTHFLGPAVKASHPGFMELFGAMFKDFLFHYSRTPPGISLSNLINRTHNLDSIRLVVRQHPAVWSDTLADMVLLQDLTNQFYVGNYHKEAILILMDAMIQDSPSPELAGYVAQAMEKLSSLVIGHPPPRFSLNDLEGNPWTPGDPAGKYTYLMFCSPDFYGCMMEYPFLQSYYLKHSAYLEIITVMVANEEKDVMDFMQRNSYDWKALYYADRSDILNDYLIRAFPTAYLIGPDGNLVLSPATLPTDGFEQQLFRIMRSRGEI